MRSVLPLHRSKVIHTGLKFLVSSRGNDPSRPKTVPSEQRTKRLLGCRVRRNTAQCHQRAQRERRFLERQPGTSSSSRACHRSAARSNRSSCWAAMSSTSESASAEVGVPRPGAVDQISPGGAKLRPASRAPGLNGGESRSSRPVGRLSPPERTGTQFAKNSCVCRKRGAQSLLAPGRSLLSEGTGERRAAVDGAATGRLNQASGLQKER